MKSLACCVLLVSGTWGAFAEAQPAEVAPPAETAPVPASTALPPSEELAPSAPAPAPVAPAPAPPAPVAVAPAHSYRQMPAVIAYRRDQTPPPGYVLSEQVRKAFLIPGISAFAAAYVSGLIVAGGVLDFPNKTGFLAIPAAGPWITLATRRGCQEDPNDTFSCTDDGLARRMLVVDGIIQGIGVGLIVAGMTWTKEVWLREDLANIQVVPTLGVAHLPGAPTPQGMSVVGRF